MSLLRGPGFQLLPGAPFKFAPCSRRPAASKKTGSCGNYSSDAWADCAIDARATTGLICLSSIRETRGSRTVP